MFRKIKYQIFMNVKLPLLPFDIRERIATFKFGPIHKKEEEKMLPHYINFFWFGGNCLEELQ